MPGQAFVTPGAAPALVIARAPTQVVQAPCGPVARVSSSGAIVSAPTQAPTIIEAPTRGCRDMPTVVGGIGIAVAIEQGPPGPRGPAGLAGIYNEPLTITEQNVIPPLSLPWKAAPGAFANIIVGAMTLVSGAGAVTFHDGSTAVDFNPDPSTGGAGINLNPGDVVVAQYNIAGV